jgi:hypothetical protein
MKAKTFVLLSVAAISTACSQKQMTAVQIPVSQINVEQLRDSIDYDMDVSGLCLGDLRVLRNAPAALQGYPFEDSYLRSIYGSTTWYDSLTYVLSEKMEVKINEKEDETWEHAFYRTIEEGKLLKYTQQELDFMKRLKAREDELRKQNFTPGEGLKVNVQNIINPTQIKEYDSLLCQQLAKDGFGIVPANHQQLFHVYERNDYAGFPSFVTTDLYLQLFHLYFDCMLRELEEQRLCQLMIDFTRGMYDLSYNMYRRAGADELVEKTAKHNADFYNIAYKLFTDKYISAPEPGSVVIEEVEHVMAATESMNRFMKDYEDIQFPYSLFRPRGHYSRTEKLQRFFRGMMWLQTVPFGMNHQEEVQQAVMMAYALKSDKELMKKYDKMNRFITFLMGKPDNLSLPQVMAEVAKTDMQMEDLLHNDAELGKVKARLEKIGNEQTRIRPAFERTSHNKICVMPQRYQPDGEVLLKMVDYDNKPTKRATPKGLDFFAAMDVTAAERSLMEEKNDWKALGDTLVVMKKRMDEIDWQETIATQWMNALTKLSAKGDSLPYFMGNTQWDRKDLNAMLASWAELKHDAILYAKQPAGAECGGGDEIPEPILKGYVEPNVAFWQKAIELLENTEKLLKQENMLTEKIERATERLHEEAEFLLRASQKELQGKLLSNEEYQQLEYIGATFENISLELVCEKDQFLQGWNDVQGADKNVALVADVYTANADNNPEKSILFEAVGNADEIFVIVEIGGYLYLTRGAVLSYREFIQPIDEPRLTDEEWQQMLKKTPRKGVPEWMKSIIVPLKVAPEPDEEVFYSSGC